VHRYVDHVARRKLPRHSDSVNSHAHSPSLRYYSWSSPAFNDIQVKGERLCCLSGPAAPAECLPINIGRHIPKAGCSRVVQYTPQGSIVQLHTSPKLGLTFDGCCILIVFRTSLSIDSIDPAQVTTAQVCIILRLKRVLFVSTCCLTWLNAGTLPQSLSRASLRLCSSDSIT
jgi:hypothetical protein